MNKQLRNSGSQTAPAVSFLPLTEEISPEAREAEKRRPHPVVADIMAWVVAAFDELERLSYQLAQGPKTSVEAIRHTRIRGNIKQQNITLSRQVTMFIARKILPKNSWTLDRIGMNLGGWNPVTVLVSVPKIAANYTDKEFDLPEARVIRTIIGNVMAKLHEKYPDAGLITPPEMAGYPISLRDLVAEIKKSMPIPASIAAEAGIKAEVFSRHPKAWTKIKTRKSRHHLPDEVTRNQGKQSGHNGAAKPAVSDPVPQEPELLPVELDSAWRSDHDRRISEYVIAMTNKSRRSRNSL